MKEKPSFCVKEEYTDCLHCKYNLVPYSDGGVCVLAVKGNTRAALLKYWINEEEEGYESGTTD